MYKTAIYCSSALLLILSGPSLAKEAPTQKSAQSLNLIRSQANYLPQPNVIYYDAIDDGQIVDGGVISVDQANPLQAPMQLKSAAPAPSYNSQTILNNGDPANRIDIVLVGDGYTSSELNQYRNHANNIVNGFFNEGVLLNYKNYFNVHRVDVISNESGVDNDPQGTDRDTALDMTYYCSNIARLLCVNVSKAKAAAQNAPQADQILALANSTTYGGAGYSSANLGTVAGNNGSALEVAIHEIGHSFADLADEYTYGGSETYTGPELNAPNVSIYQKAAMQQQQTKWYRWFNVAGVDTFEGGHYSVYGVYRPTQNSKMRSLGQPFGPINDEQFVIKIYQSVSPIDNATPAGNVNRGETLTVTTTQPQSHDLDIQWWVNGQLTNNTSNVFNTASLPPGDHTVAVRVTDNTDLVRDESARQQWMTAERVWTVIDNGNTPLADLSLTQKTTSLMGWATPFQFWKNTDTGSVTFNAVISNNGPDTAQNITLEQPIPSDGHFSFASYESDQANCYMQNNTVICETASLNSGESVNVLLNFNTTTSDRVDFTTTVSSTTNDPDTSNNAKTRKFGGSLSWLLLSALAGLMLRRNQ